MIKTIKWHKYKVLQDLELNFGNSANNDKIFNTIILAGENGTGKSTILDSLATFLNIGTFEPFEQISYIINDELYSLFKYDGGNSNLYHMRSKVSTGCSHSVSCERSLIDRDTEDVRHYGVLYSRAKTGFNAHPITSTANSQLDDNKYDIDTGNDYTGIKQLLVDIETQDGTLCKRELESRSILTMDEFLPICKINRFKNAFNNFFENIKFIGIDDENKNEKKIIFEKYGNIISIDELSTGEKQIVFRGAQMLRNMNNMHGGIVLIDEPELSMHPKWQEKILNFYKDLFMDENGNQTVQIIISTHSDYVIKSALEDTDNNLIIILNDNNGIIEPNYVTGPFILPTITAAEVNYLAFGIYSIDYHAQLYGYLQNKIAQNKNITECSVKCCDDYIAQSPSYISKYDFQSQHPKYGTLYNTLPTYIRNKIDHPDFKNSFTQAQLQLSTEFLRKLCQLP